MENVLSLFFSPERTYIAYLEKTTNGLKLNKIGTTSSTIDLENLENPINQHSLEELYSFASQWATDTNLLTISIPMEYVIITQFPGRPNITTEEIMSVINIEIRQNYPQFNPEEFPTYLFQLAPRKEQTYFLASIIPKKIFQNVKILSNKMNKIVQRIEISQIASHNCLLYNYPEEKENFVAIFNVSDKFIDYSVIRGEEFYFYNLIKFNNYEQIPNLIEQNIGKVNNEFNISITSLYFFGTHLNKITLDKVSKYFENKQKNIKRLNAFRLVTTELDDASQQICARLAHHFPSCVGSILPELHKRIKVY